MFAYLDWNTNKSISGQLQRHSKFSEIADCARKINYKYAETTNTNGIKIKLEEPEYDPRFIQFYI